MEVQRNGTDIADRRDGTFGYKKESENLILDTPMCYNKSKN
jgi:hypothetical protein